MSDELYDDGLGLELNREVIMSAGFPGTGKSYSIVKLALWQPDRLVLVIDRDRGVGKAIRELCGRKKPANLLYRLVKTWDDLEQYVDEALTSLGVDDWLCFDQIGRLWDLAQSEFSRKVYGDEITKRLLVLRAEAEEIIRGREINPKSTEATAARARETGFQGLEGRYDWPLIKRMHNDDVFDRVILDGNFNVFSTTSLDPLADDDIKKRKYPMWQNIQAKPEGEKHQTYRHDTVIVTYRRDESYFWRTDLGGGQGKDRGREFVRDIDFTGQGLIESYLTYHLEEV